MKSEPLLCIEELEIRAGKDVLVDGAGLAIGEREIVGLVGESGSGKTLTALSVLGLLPPAVKLQRGSVLFSDEEMHTDLTTLSTAEMNRIRGRRISMIFQEPMTSLNPTLRCGYQASEPLITQMKSGKKAARQKVMELFNEVGLPDPERVFRSWPHELSGGQRQRVMIAQALSTSPALLIADEPTTALDVTVQKKILDLLLALKEKFGLSILLISHDLGVVNRVADQIVVMEKGRIVETGSRQQVMEYPESPYTRGLIACRPRLDAHPHRLPTVVDFVSGKMVTTRMARPDRERESARQGRRSGHGSGTQIGSEIGTGYVFESGSGKKAESGNETGAGSKAGSESWTGAGNETGLGSWTGSSQEPGKTNRLQVPLVTVKNLEVVFRSGRKQEVKAVRNITLDIYRGETLGLVGESGSGKTTLGRSILRLLGKQSGMISFEGQNLDSISAKAFRKIRRRMQIVFQDPYSSLNPRMTIGTIVGEPFRIHKLQKTTGDIRNASEQLLDRVGLPASAMQKYPHEFSGGQRQRICIARALACSPDFIVLDESVSALDVSIQAQVINLLNDLKDELGLTYLFISHDLAVVNYMSDRIIVMKEGQIIEEAAAGELHRHPKNEYTRELINSIPN